MCSCTSCLFIWLHSWGKPEIFQAFHASSDLPFSLFSPLWKLYRIMEKAFGLIQIYTCCLRRRAKHQQHKTVLRWSMPGHTQTSWCMPPNMWKHILRRPTICTAVICIRHLFAHMQRSKTVLSKMKLCLHLGIISIINKTWIFFLIRLIVVNLNNK